ncbi:hypothetical protein KP509_21G082100 [Ceratopteris richardii]|uniref:Uncharacterized protein n=1 Tax=Ceratopteris richardii TaxID=49495 RepID=A0A8T2SFA2_CERRI|nr:hypothetical protein KP509_21G082100 [Ceratopteris richardii]
MMNSAANSNGGKAVATVVEWEFDDRGNYWYCKYNGGNGDNGASGMAAAAFCLLLVGTLIVMGATRCFCCGSPHMPGASRLCAVLAFTLCWLFFGIAEILLLAGANRNSLKSKTNMVAGEAMPSCELIRSSIFAAAAAFTFLAWILSQVYYIFEVRCRLEGPTFPSTSPSPNSHHQNAFSIPMTPFPPPPMTPTSPSPYPPVV